MDENRDLGLLKAVVSIDSVLGPDNFALCPFHEEKTASFNIFHAMSGKARFHCFGCGADGDIFDYMKRKYGRGYHHAKIWLTNFRNANPTTQSPPPPSVSLSGLPGNRASKSPDSEIGTSPFCELDCQQYANLREDYNILLEENHKLRELLGMGEFRPSNET